MNKIIIELSDERLQALVDSWYSCTVVTMVVACVLLLVTGIFICLCRKKVLDEAFPIISGVLAAVLSFAFCINICIYNEVKADPLGYYKHKAIKVIK